MGNGSNTLRVLILYLVLLVAGQALAVGVGLILDPISKTAALAAFIPIYYAMYWIAWRVALIVADRTPEAAEGASPSKLATWLLAPAVLAFDIAE